MRRNLFRLALGLSAIWFSAGRADAQIIIPPESPDLIRGSWSIIDPPSGTFVEIFTLSGGTADFLRQGSVLNDAGLPTNDLNVDLTTYRTDPPPNFSVGLSNADQPGGSQLRIFGPEGVAVFDIANPQIDPFFSDPESGRVRIFADASFNPGQSNIIDDGFDLSGFTNGGLEIIYSGIPTFGILIEGPGIFVDGFADYTTDNGAVDASFRITTHQLGFVPEPSTVWFLAGGVAALGLIGLRRRSRLCNALFT